MEKQQNTQQQETSGPESKGKNPKRSRMLVMLAVTGVIVFAGLVLSCGKKAGEDATREKAASAESAKPAHSETDLKKLVGRWLRLDGGYVIEIEGVLAGGDLAAAYFNPEPINVSQARVTSEADGFRVFIELYDKGYPGSTYTLTYDPGSDALFGTYFQAALGQRFDVVFVRMR